MRKNKLLAGAIAAAILILLVIMLVDLAPLIKELISNKNGGTQQEINYIKSYGAKGIPILIILQMLQVFVTILPDTPIQILAGLCYGVWLGTLICFIGFLLGNVSIFIAIRYFKANFIHNPEKGKKKKENRALAELGKLKNIKRPEYAAVILYIIPGLPSGLLPYLFAQTSISTLRYFISIAIASVPSIILSTWVGKSIAAGNYTLAVVLFAALTAALIILFLLRKKILARLEASSASSAQKQDNAQQAV